MGVLEWPFPYRRMIRNIIAGKKGITFDWDMKDIREIDCSSKTGKPARTRLSANK